MSAAGPVRTSPPEAPATPSRLPGLLLGLGLGGFLDGIVLHQILQWHHLVSDTHGHPTTTVAGLRANTLADGLFHLLAWAFVVLGTSGLIISWRRGRRAPSPLFQLGLLLTGWGLFNVVEGVVDHQLLGIHHVRDDLGGPLSWDLGFLVFGALLVVGGWALHRVGDATAPDCGVPERAPGSSRRDDRE